MTTRKLDLLAAVAFVLGLLALAFLTGFFSGKNRGWFYRPLMTVEETVRGVWNAYLDTPDYLITGKPGAPLRATARTLDPARMAPGVTLLAGYTLEGFEAWLVDAQGERLHTWRARFSETFPEPTHLLWQARDNAIAWQGMHLYPNGDLLLSFQDHNFPFGSGLVKLDKDSKIVWKLARNTHHDVAVDPDDGTIWVPAHRYRPEGLPGFPTLAPWYYEDTVLQIAPDGTVKDEISVLEALKDAQGLLSITYKLSTGVEESDPTHLNSAEPLPAAWAERFPGLAAGDLLVSLRNVNALLVIDRATKKAKRVFAGPFVRQHDADFLPNGHLLVFDNLGGDPACGGTRVLEFDPADMGVAWRYDGCRDGGFASITRGMQESLPNGNVLIADPHGGRALEVTRDPEAKLVWEYVNVVGAEDDRPLLGAITHAQRFAPGELTFLPR
jgi:hypothetical protein